MRSALLFLGILTACLAQALGQTPGPQYTAEVLRNMKGRGIDASGFANVDVPLYKGMTYEVVKNAIGQVTLDVGGQKVVVSSKEVQLKAKPMTAPPPPGGSPASPTSGPSVVVVYPGGFVPGGKIVILSARYTLGGNQARNVKSKVEKLIPPGELTRPVEILVSDALSHAAQSEAAATSQTVAVVTPEVAIVESQTRVAGRNILTVEYIYNNQRLIKQGIEGTRIVLP